MRFWGVLGGLLLIGVLGSAQDLTIPALLLGAAWSLYSAGATVLPRPLAILTTLLLLPCILGILLTVVGILGVARPLTFIAGALLTTAAMSTGIVARALLRRQAATEVSNVPQLHVGWAGAAGSAIALVIVASAHVTFGVTAFAWALSGDARNHLALTQFIVAQGGLTQPSFAFVPPLGAALVALLTLTKDATGDSPGTALQRGAWALEVFAVTSIVVWCFAAGILVAVVSSSPPFSTRIAAAMASLIPLAGVSAGVALRDGFIPSLLVIPILTGAIALATWLWRTNPGRLATRVVILALCSGAIAASSLWSAFALAPVVALLLVTSAAIVRRRVLSLSEASVYLGATAVLSGLPLLPGVLAGTSVGHATNTGTIVAPPFAAFCGVVLIVAFRFVSFKRTPFHLTPYFAGSAAVALGLAWAMLVQDPSNRWNYYPAKLSWTWIAATMPVLVWALMPRQFSQRADHSVTNLDSASPVASSLDSAKHRPRTIRNPSPLVELLRMLLPATAVAAIFYLGSPLPSPFLSEKRPGVDGGFSIASGWSQPSATTMRAVIERGSNVQSSRVVFWDLSGPGNDRLANFWLASYDIPYQDGSTIRLSNFALWAYFYEFGSVDNLCELLKAEPSRSVRTSNAELAQVLKSRCAVTPLVEVVPSIQ